jgi:hypothetical protein
LFLLVEEVGEVDFGERDFEQMEACFESNGVFVVLQFIWSIL